MKFVLSFVLAGVAIVLGALAIGVSLAESGKSPEGVVEEYITALKQANFGVACSTLSDEYIGVNDGSNPGIDAMTREQAVQRCATAYSGAIAQALLFGAPPDVFAGVEVLDSFPTADGSGTVVQTIDCFEIVGGQDFVVEDGKIVDNGPGHSKYDDNGSAAPVCADGEAT